MSSLRDALLLWFPLNLLLCTACLWLGVSLSVWLLPVSCVLALAGAACLQPAGRRWPALMMAALLWAMLLWLAAQLDMWMVDQNWDSRAYHGPAIIALRDGWNPLQITHTCDWRQDYCGLYFMIGVDHYPKAAWLSGAQFYALFRDLDAAKVPHFLALVLTALVAWDCLVRWLPGQRWLAVLGALVIAGNPVSLAQLFSGYIDGQLASALTCLILSLMDVVLTGNRAALWRAAAVLPWLANLKLTGLVYGCAFIGLFALLVALRCRQVLPRFLAWQAAAVLLAVVLGFNPYFSNWQDHGNPFYPAYQPGTTVIDQQAVGWFMAKNRVEQFLIATFSVQDGMNWGVPKLVWPFAHPVYTPMVEARFGAFGPLFSGSLIAALVMLPLLRRSGFGWLAVAVMLSVFLTAAGWWARLAPQAWLAVALVPLGICRLHRAGWRREAGVALLALLLLNNLLVMRSVYYAQGRAAATFHRQLAEAVTAQAALRAVSQWEGGEFGIYNHRKLTDSLQMPGRLQPDCEAVDGNRIFLRCR